jgi:predicted nucleotidyltransferase component of viral defense system
MLNWNTVDSALKNILITLISADEFKDFRLVGGTALSLYLGHRVSVDVDLFTDATYGSINFDAIETFIKNTFAHVEGEFGGNAGMGRSYLVGTDRKHLVKLDLYYAMDPFFEHARVEDGIRMATVEEIIAMKVDVVQRSGRKKDFWDLHELLGQYSIAKMIDLHRKRYQWTHDEQLIKVKFTDFAAADEDLDPICLRKKEWIFIKEDIEEASLRGN